MLIQKSVKGLGKCAHFPAVALMLLRGRMFRGLLRWSCSPILPKIFINKLPRLASVPPTEVVLQTLSIQSRDFEEIFLTSSRRRAPAFSATFLALVLLLFNPSALCSAGIYILEYYYKESDKDSLIYFVRFNSSELRMGV